MSDGAHLGVSANRALKTVLGGEPSPDESEQQAPDEMREWLLAAPPVEDFQAELDSRPPDEKYTDEDYGECARVAAKVILEAFLADPRLAAAPPEMEYDWDADPDRGSQGMKAEFIIHPGLSRLLSERDVTLPVGMSGFQWGWAVNAARFCVELPAAPNPAIIEI